MTSFVRLVSVVCLLVGSASMGQDKTPSAGASSLQLPASDQGQPGAGPIRRTDRFLKLWETRRTEWAKRVAQDQGAVVLLGDSITQGWGTRTDKEFPNVKIANRGISADTTRGMLIRIQDVIALRPAAVVMLMGTNDLEMGGEPQTIAGNVRLMLDALKQSDPKLPIILCLVFPSSETKSRPADKIKALNEAYSSMVKGDPQVTVVDTWTLFADPMGNARPEWFPDLLHLNDQGYQKWGAALRPILATLGFLETEPDPFTPEAGFVSLFNGRDLTGWGYRPTPADQVASIKKAQAKDPSKGPARPIVTEAISFDGKTQSPDGRYVAKHGRLIVTTPPEGRKIQQLWTTQEFPDDFTLKLEFRATPNADSGVFIRQPQLQCRDYPLAGPYTQLKAYRPGDWNELVVEVRGRQARCTCNGEVLEEAFSLPATGPIGLEGDRGQMEYRRIRIQTRHP